MFEKIVKKGKKYILIKLMVIIEKIRNMIRKGKLEVSLNDNIIEGKLLLKIIGKNGK
jgi:hypothetical protein